MIASTPLLLAEDDEALGYLLKEYLQLNDFEVTLCKNGEDAISNYIKKYFSIAVVDVMMPVKDGFTLLEEIKSNDPLFPVLLLTSKSLKVDKLKGFKAGADDYIVKPVDEEELVARIHAVLRRCGKSVMPDTNQFAIGKYIFDFSNRTLLFGSEVRSLSSKEAELLRELCINAGKVVERMGILKKIWGTNDYFTRKSMDVFIYKLRNYLKKDLRVKILNIHGKGFVLKISAAN